MFDGEIITLEYCTDYLERRILSRLKGAENHRPPVFTRLVQHCGTVTEGNVFYPDTGKAVDDRYELRIFVITILDFFK